MRIGTFATMLTAMFVLGSASRLSAQEAKPATKREPSQALLRREAKVAEADARKTALAEVPRGKVQSHELERENGKLIYSYDIKVAGRAGTEEVNVDAITGAVVAHEHEDAKAEVKEKKAEAKERKKP